jgi:hypothetical protein
MKIHRATQRELRKISFASLARRSAKLNGPARRRLAREKGQGEPADS